MASRAPQLREYADGARAGRESPNAGWLPGLLKALGDTRNAAKLALALLALSAAGCVASDTGRPIDERDATGGDTGADIMPTLDSFEAFFKDGVQVRLDDKSVPGQLSLIVKGIPNNPDLRVNVSEVFPDGTTMMHPNVYALQPDPDNPDADPSASIPVDHGAAKFQITLTGSNGAQVSEPNTLPNPFAGDEDPREELLAGTPELPE